MSPARGFRPDRHELRARRRREFRWCSRTRERVLRRTHLLVFESPTTRGPGTPSYRARPRRLVPQVARPRDGSRAPRFPAPLVGGRGAASKEQNLLSRWLPEPSSTKVSALVISAPPARCATMIERLGGRLGIPCSRVISSNMLAAAVAVEPLRGRCSVWQPSRRRTSAASSLVSVSLWCECTSNGDVAVITVSRKGVAQSMVVQSGVSPRRRVITVIMRSDLDPACARPSVGRTRSTGRAEREFPDARLACHESNRVRSRLIYRVDGETSCTTAARASAAASPGEVFTPARSPPRCRRRRTMLAFVRTTRRGARPHDASPGNAVAER